MFLDMPQRETLETLLQGKSPNVKLPGKEKFRDQDMEKQSIV
jgi:hypothetical protein